MVGRIELSILYYGAYFGLGLWFSHINISNVDALLTIFIVIIIDLLGSAKDNKETEDKKNDRKVGF